MTPIVVDSSALMAILLKEPHEDALSTVMILALRCHLSAATLVETGIVTHGRLGDDGTHRLDMLLLDLNVEVLPLTALHAFHARDAFRRYGKGRHPARLNLGDCFSYALAKALDEPLLFVGDDFSQTDITAVAY